VLADLELGPPPVARHERLLRVPLPLDAGDAIADPRLFVANGRLYCSYVYEKAFYSRAMQGLCEIEPDGNILANDVYDGPQKPHDKNWQFFEHDGELLLVYGLFPEHLVRDRELKVRGRSATFPWRWGPPKPTAPPVRVGDRYVTFFHSYLGNTWRERYYAAGYYSFSAQPPFEILEHSAYPLLVPDLADRPTWAEHSCNVFPSGCLRDGNDWLMTYGYYDRWSCLLRLADLTAPRFPAVQGERILWGDHEAIPAPSRGSP
jgi:hypothetical protein